MLDQQHYQIARRNPEQIPDRQILAYTYHAESALHLVTAISTAKPETEYAVYGSTDPKHPIARYLAGRRL
jgi:hypothetical protein